ncbi:DUF2461 domain-containing protein [Hymenobacter weizhouensis]|uniref:DUF2461 domain-containing protein n=1 Tax=Hymenobacter sp. YIM 151500-1 TaxID=2987689 RepID=UPI002227C007|nr:DUF2461 domain-containing protein [Hymenobacter sp. YIM 151500-1]UYZ63231.1 DUF2461 domain-containing protein [Hymenobacter sp. YIM 151500-1]
MNTAALLDFLADLALHNDRDWFQARKGTYDGLRRDFEAAVGRWLPELARLDPTLAGLEARRCIFRIYRDVRFSRNKDPYKTHFSAYFAAGGKAGTGPGYYVQIGPNGQTLLAGGLYQPDREQLARIRQEIDYNGASLHALLQAPEFREFFPNGLEGEKLKKAPAGYPTDHPDVELLKHKSFIAAYAIPDATARGLDLDATVPAAFRALQPLCTWLREAVTPGE